MVHHILHTLKAVSTELTLDHEVVGDRNATVSVLYEATLVDQMTNGLQCGVAVGNVGIGNAQHVLGGLVQLDECTIVDLAQTEQLQNLADLRSNLVDTTDTNDKRHLRLGRDVDVAL
uniref:Uncharacterized protein n=1 Tax=Anopheles christyi TaxID=43041 RepID=A0A182KJ34_9DIPT